VFCFGRVKNGSQVNRLRRDHSEAGSAHAAVPEEETCVGLDYPEGVAIGAWSFGRGFVDVGFGGIEFEILRKGSADS
jgi:hypothetical protein